jgi:hypothetical protein
MGQKMVRFAQLGAARSRQDESIEVGEVGSKRPSLGGNGWGAFRLVGWADLRLVADRLPLFLLLFCFIGAPYCTSGLASGIAGSAIDPGWNSEGVRMVP